MPRVYAFCLSHTVGSKDKPRPWCLVPSVLMWHSFVNCFFLSWLFHHVPSVLTHYWLVMSAQPAKMHSEPIDPQAGSSHVLLFQGCLLWPLGFRNLLSCLKDRSVLRLCRCGLWASIQVYFVRNVTAIRQILVREMLCENIFSELPLPVYLDSDRSQLFSDQ